MCVFTCGHVIFLLLSNVNVIINVKHIKCRNVHNIGLSCICAEAARIIYEICLALEFLHTNDIAHRDLKVTVHCIAYFTFQCALDIE